MISKFYEENQEKYVKGFACFMSELTDKEFTTDEVKQLFKDYMLDYKNIKVDFREKFWVITFQKSMKEAGFVFCGLPYNF